VLGNNAAKPVDVPFQLVDLGRKSGKIRDFDGLSARGKFAIVKDDVRLPLHDSARGQKQNAAYKATMKRQSTG